MKANTIRAAIAGLAVALGGAIAAPALAQWENPNRVNEFVKIRFTNESGRSLYALHISPRFTGEWQELLGSRIVKNEDSVEIEFRYQTLVDAGCEYNIRAVYSNGNRTDLRGPFFNLCELRQIRLGPVPSITPFEPY